MSKERDAGHQPPRTELFTPRQVLLSSLFLSPLSGAFLFAVNLRALKRRGGFALVLAFGALVVGVVALEASDDAVRFVIAITHLPSAFALAWFAHRLFTPLIGLGNKRPAHIAVGFAFLPFIGLVAFLLVAGVTLALFGPLKVREQLLDGIAHSDGEWVFYADGAARLDAERVSTALATLGTFSGHGTLELSLSRQRGRLTALVELDEEVIESGQARAWATLAAQALADTISPPECIRLQVAAFFEAERVNFDACPSRDPARSHE